MGRDVNTVILSGRVGSDPVISTLNGGTKRAKFRFATDDSYTQNGMKHERTTWTSITCWGQAADTIERFVRKGQLITLEGSLEYSEWTDQQSGQKRSALGVRANRIHLLPKSLNPTTSTTRVEGHEEPSEDEQQVTNGVAAGHPVTGKATPEDDDIPF